LSSFRVFFLGKREVITDASRARAGKSSNNLNHRSFPSRVHHGLRLLVSGSKSGAVNAFLLLLHQGTARAAARSTEIAEGRSFDAVLVTHLAALDGLQDARTTNVRQAGPRSALLLNWSQSVGRGSATLCCEESAESTSYHQIATVRILVSRVVQTVMGPAKQDARAPACAATYGAL
jgi:hypothetical protein